MRNKKSPKARHSQGGSTNVLGLEVIVAGQTCEQAGNGRNHDERTGSAETGEHGPRAAGEAAFLKAMAGKHSYRYGLRLEQRSGNKTARAANYFQKQKSGVAD